MQILLTQSNLAMDHCVGKTVHSNSPSYFRGVGIHKAVHMYLSSWQIVKGVGYLFLILIFTLGNISVTFKTTFLSTWFSELWVKAQGVCYCVCFF